VKIDIRHVVLNLLTKLNTSYLPLNYAVCYWRSKSHVMIMITNVLSNSGYLRG